ncbi:MAG: thioredoxin family protein [Planctomycetaceae bacterium]|nr:thioredoxin family protein [Planctomycetaceae bacterium]MBT6497224.1 thioredoxin family protein [Planctomycetaceae bacterium]
MVMTHRPIPHFRPSTPPVTSDSIDAIVASHAVVVVHFWAEWNGVDPVMDSRIRNIRNHLPFDIHFVSCNIDDPSCIDLTKSTGVLNIPFLAVYVHGQQRRGIMGLHEPDALVSELNDRINFLKLSDDGGDFGIAPIT